MAIGRDTERRSRTSLFDLFDGIEAVFYAVGALTLLACLVGRFTSSGVALRLPRGSNEVLVDPSEDDPGALVVGGGDTMDMAFGERE